MPNRFSPEPDERRPRPGPMWRSAARATLLPSILLAGCLWPACAPATPEAALEKTGRPPNIVLILADDLGWMDTGVYGSRFYETPSIDRLSAQGMRFTNAYASASQCAPTRACLLTGRDIPRHGIWAVSRLRGLEKFRKLVPPENETSLPLSETTLADALREGGYRTGMFGKWHLGTEAAYLPDQRGFDDSVTFPRAYEYFGFTTRPPMEVGPGTYLTDFLTDQAIRFIEENQDRPFFLYLPHFAVHGPLVGKAELIEHYLKKEAKGGQQDPVYAAMIHSLDESVGRILSCLDATGLSQNTLFIFYSDNGGAGGYERDGIRWFSPTTNEPLRGGKGMLYEGGIRVPLIVRWPGVIEPGSVRQEAVTSTDFFPTLLEVAGLQAGRLSLDGTSFLPLLKGEGDGSWERGPIYWHYPGYLQAEVEKGTWRITPSGAIRSGDFKLIEFFEDGRTELYDLGKDPGETHDLSAAMPEQVGQLRRLLGEWRESTGARMPSAKTGQTENTRP